MNANTQINDALNEAESWMRALDNYANLMARLLSGRLRKVDADILRKLKRELSQFDGNTRKWKT